MPIHRVPFVLAEAAEVDPVAGAIVLVVVLAILGVYVGSIVWAYGDAEARGKSGCLVALLVFLLTWPVGLIIWVIFRPPLDGGNP